MIQKRLKVLILLSVLESLQADDFLDISKYKNILIATWCFIFCPSFISN